MRRRCSRVLLRVRQRNGGDCSAVATGFDLRGAMMFKIKQVGGMRAVQGRGLERTGLCERGVEIL